MPDLKFDEIITELQSIHSDHPDLRFGLIVQASVDKSKMTRAYDFHDISSKEILAALKDYHDEIGRVN